MNNNDNNILIAQQGNCDVALVNGTKILHYKDGRDNEQSLDFANLTDGKSLFVNNTNLNVDWDISLPALTSADHMFSRCTNLTSFTGDLPNLTNGTSMFGACVNLTSWTVELPNLTNGNGMFASCERLSSWTVDLPNLTNGSNMLYYSKLTSWTIELPNLTDGTYMFTGSNLTSFSVELPKLTRGSSMFAKCKLDKASVHRIAESIPTKSAGASSSDYKLTLGIDASLETDTDVAADLETIKTTKQWTLTTQWN